MILNVFSVASMLLWQANHTSYSYPMPTLALINGHAFAAGFMTAMFHDYRIMNPHKGFLCLNELDFGASLKPPMASIFRQKLSRPETYRTMVLESKRFKALEALKEEIVDGVGGLEEAKLFIKESKLIGKGDSGAYGRLKEEMWRETVGFLDEEEKVAQEYEDGRTTASEGRVEYALKTVKEWEKEGWAGKPKL